MMEQQEVGSILVIVDNLVIGPGLCEILRSFTRVRCASSSAAARQLAHETVPDLVILDLEAPALDGLEICRAFKAAPPLAHVPIICLTSPENTELASLGLILGAADCITKPLQPEAVVQRVRALLYAARADTLCGVVPRDLLTGAATRTHFNQVLGRRFAHARHSGRSLCLLLTALDGMQDCGAEDAAADSALQAVAAAFRVVVARPSDLLARYGSGVFATLLPDTGARGGMVVALRTMAAVDDLRLPPMESSRARHLSLSIGVAVFSESSATTAVPEDLATAAAHALAAARAAGGRTVRAAELEYSNQTPSARSSSGLL